MNAESGSEIELKEQTFLFSKESSSVVNQTRVEIKASNLQNGVKDDAFSKENVDPDESIVIPNNETIEITIWRNRKIQINKALIPLRLAQFLWFASGSLCSQFFSLMLTHRGLKVIEFSSIFSMLFLCQFAVAYIFGIIADKLGNAKPVLLYLMLGTLACVIGLALCPDVRDRSCLESNINVTCFSPLNNTLFLEYCKNTCTNNAHLLTDVYAYNNNNNSVTFSNRSNFASNNQIFEDAIYSNGTVVFCNETCSCFVNFEESCIHASKVGFKILYSILILLFFSHWSTSYRFLEFAALNIGKEHDSDFGIFRFFGMLGSLFASVLCNLVLNIDKSAVKETYDNVLWLSVLLSVMSALSACYIKIVRLPPGVNFTKKTLKLFTDTEIMPVILIAFAAGIAYTFNMFYHLWFLNSLKASKRIIGMHTMTSPVYSLPILITSKWWLKQLEIKKIFVITFLAYTINDMSYSFLYHPWLSLFIEITKAFSFHLFWVALIVHCHKIAPTGFAATVNALAGAIHFGIGRSFSVPVGGYLISTLGIRQTYRILAGFCLLNAILYLTFLYSRRLLSKNDYGEKGKDPEEMTSMKENVA